MVEFILYVADQERSRNFYEKVLDTPPVLDMPGMTEFILQPDCKLGLMPETGIAKILQGSTPHPSTANGVPRCELYLYTDNLQRYVQRLYDAGAKEISPVQLRSWGDKVGYFADPCGHIFAIAERS